MQLENDEKSFIKISSSINSKNEKLLHSVNDSSTNNQHMLIQENFESPKSKILKEKQIIQMPSLTSSYCSTEFNIYNPSENTQVTSPCDQTTKKINENEQQKVFSDYQLIEQNHSNKQQQIQFKKKNNDEQKQQEFQLSNQEISKKCFTKNNFKELNLIKVEKSKLQSNINPKVNEIVSPPIYPNNILNEIAKLQNLQFHNKPKISYQGIDQASNKLEPRQSHTERLQLQIFQDQKSNYQKDKAHFEDNNNSQSNLKKIDNNLKIKKVLIKQPTLSSHNYKNNQTSKMLSNSRIQEMEKIYAQSKSFPKKITQDSFSNSQQKQQQYFLPSRKLQPQSYQIDKQSKQNPSISQTPVPYNFLTNNISASSTKASNISSKFHLQNTNIRLKQQINTPNQLQINTQFIGKGNELKLKPQGQSTINKRHDQFSTIENSFKTPKQMQNIQYQSQLPVISYQQNTLQQNKIKQFCQANKCKTEVFTKKDSSSSFATKNKQTSLAIQQNLRIKKNALQKSNEQLKQNQFLEINSIISSIQQQIVNNNLNYNIVKNEKNTYESLFSKRKNQ